MLRKEGIYEIKSSYGYISRDHYSLGQAGTVSVTLGSDSEWILTGDSYISEFEGDIDNIDTNGFHVYVDGKELV